MRLGPCVARRTTDKSLEEAHPRSPHLRHRSSEVVFLTSNKTLEYHRSRESTATQGTEDKEAGTFGGRRNTYGMEGCLPVRIAYMYVHTSVYNWEDPSDPTPRQTTTLPAWIFPKENSSVAAYILFVFERIV